MTTKESKRQNMGYKETMINKVDFIPTQLNRIKFEYTIMPCPENTVCCRISQFDCSRDQYGRPTGPPPPGYRICAVWKEPTPPINDEPIPDPGPQPAKKKISVCSFYC